MPASLRYDMQGWFVMQGLWVLSPEIGLVVRLSTDRMAGEDHMSNDPSRLPVYYVRRAKPYGMRGKEKLTLYALTRGAAREKKQ